MTDTPDETDETEAAPGPLDIDKAFRNIVQLVQTNPVNYKKFGVFWWPIKALLKRSGYGPNQLYMLGSFNDPETAAMVPKLSLEDTIRAALAEYTQNTVFPHADGRVENDEGELVTIYDADAQV